MNFFMIKQISVSDSSNSVIKELNFGKNQTQPGNLYLIISEGKFIFFKLEPAIRTDIDFEKEIFFMILLQKIPYLIGLITRKYENIQYQTLCGVSFAPLGVSKLKLIELLSLATKIQAPACLLEILNSHNIFQTIIVIFKNKQYIKIFYS